MTQEATPDPKFIGKPYMLEGETEYIKKESHLLEFFAFERPAGPPTEDEIAQLDALSAKMKSDDDIIKYMDSCGKELEHCGTQGYTTIEVLEFFKGKKLTNLVLAYVYGLNPTKIRISKGEWTCDCCTGRVSITIDDANVIQKITQEVTVGYGCGADIAQCLEESRTGRKPAAFSGCIGHTAGLLRANFE